MPLWWGLDSAVNANYVRKQNTPSFYDRVIALTTPPEVKAKNLIRRPQFWGRYLTGVAGPPLTLVEVNYLMTRSVGLLVIHNGFDKGSVTRDEAEGTRVANEAIKKAVAVITRSMSTTWIYANIDNGFEPTAGWLTGWMKAMYRSPFGGVGGFYCNTAFGTFNSSLYQAIPKVAADVGRSEESIRNWCKLFIINAPKKKWTSGVELRKEQIQLAFNPKQCWAHPTGSAIWQVEIGVFRPDPTSSDIGAGVDLNIINENGYKGMLWP